MNPAVTSESWRMTLLSVVWGCLLLGATLVTTTLGDSDVRQGSLIGEGRLDMYNKGKQGLS